MNSLQSAGEGSVDPSRSGDPPGLRLGLEDGVRGSLYKDLKKQKDYIYLNFTPPFDMNYTNRILEDWLFGFPFQECLFFSDLFSIFKAKK